LSLGFHQLLELLTHGVDAQVLVRRLFLGCGLGLGGLAGPYRFRSRSIDASTLRTASTWAKGARQLHEELRDLVQLLGDLFVVEFHVNTLL
jgi:hypothetical protein